MKEKSLIILPNQPEKPEWQEYEERIAIAELTLQDCQKALQAFALWHRSKKSRSSQDCDNAMILADNAGRMLNQYLNLYGVKK